MRPELMQIMSSMQQHSTHYSVKADGSDGSVMLDSIHAFCTTRAVTEASQVHVTEIIENLKGKIGTVPKHLIEPVMETMERIRSECQSMLKDLQTAKADGAKVSEADLKELRDREAQVTDLLAKLEDKLAGKATPGALRDAQKTGKALSTEIAEMRGAAQSIIDGQSPEVTELLTGIPAKPVLPPEQFGIECVVHAAGVLADGLIMTSTNTLPAGMSKVYGAKAHGAWQLFHAMNAIG